MLHEPLSSGSLTPRLLHASSQSTCPSRTVSLHLYFSASLYMSVRCPYSILCYPAFFLSRGVRFIFLQFQRLSVCLFMFISVFLPSVFILQLSIIQNKVIFIVLCIQSFKTWMYRRLSVLLSKLVYMHFASIQPSVDFSLS